MWWHQRDEAGWERGRAAIRVDAPAEVLWQVITDYDAYVEFLPYVTESVTLSRQREGAAERIRSQYALTVRGVVTRYHLEGLFSAAEGALHFRYLPEGGPLAEGEGWWRVSAWPEGGSLLEYEVALRPRWWVPGFLTRAAAERGLADLVRLMGARAERAVADGLEGVDSAGGE